MVKFYSIWNITALQFGTTTTQKLSFCDFLLGNCVFIYSNVVFPYCTHRNLSFGTKIKPLWHCNGILRGKICLKIWLKGRPKVIIWGFVYQNTLITTHAYFKVVLLNEAVLLKQNLWFLDIMVNFYSLCRSLKHHCPPVWHHDNSKFEFLWLFVRKLCFYWFEYGLFELY